MDMNPSNPRKETMYLVTRLPSSKRFAVTHVLSETAITRIGIYATRQQATTVARLLAGWRGKVVQG